MPLRSVGTVPLMHRALQTINGLVRFSFSHFSKAEPKWHVLAEISEEYGPKRWLRCRLCLLSAQLRPWLNGHERAGPARQVDTHARGHKCPVRFGLADWAEDRNRLLEQAQKLGLKYERLVELK